MSGNSARAQARMMSTFAPWWKPWRWCWARSLWAYDRGEPTRRHRCRLPRRHLGRHATFDGFDVRYFDSAKDGTP